MSLKFTVLILLCVAALCVVTMADQVEARDGRWQTYTYGGFLCISDCLEHAQGCQIAQNQGFKNPRTCQQAPTLSQQEGCIAYMEEPWRDCWRDDDDREIAEW
ncbi:MAG: hypothetical protein AAGG72_10475 [Pseudomonadota bacterium]